MANTGNSRRSLQGQIVATRIDEVRLIFAPEKGEKQSKARTEWGPLKP